jgi:hypothetical protein
VLLLLASLISTAQLAIPSPKVALGRTAWIFLTVGQSEWCPAGNVMLDLRTGSYALTPRAQRSVCNDANLERPVIHGRLVGEQLAAARSAYLRVLSEGLESPVCRSGRRPNYIVISNGGPQILLVANGSSSISAPDDLTCWSEAATALHDALDRVFNPNDYQSHPAAP